MFFVWIPLTQFVKTSNLSQVVEVAEKDGLASVELNSSLRMSKIGAKLQQLVMYGVAT